MSCSGPLSDHPLSQGDECSRSDVRIDAPHLHSSETGARTHPSFVQTHSAAIAAPSASLPLRTSDATAVAQQLRTQAVQLADQLAVRQDELDRREAELNARSTELEANLDNARHWLSEREADLERLRQQWIEERRKAEAELEAARQRLGQEHRRDWAELQEKRRVLEQRAEQVDHATVALQQVQEEVARVHRETLQMRLANEELLAQMASLVPAEVRERTLQEIRLKLSAEFRQASEELSRKKQELLAIRRDLSDQHRKLSQERDRLHRLAAHVSAERRRNAVSKRP